MQILNVSTVLEKQSLLQVRGARIIIIEIRMEELKLLIIVILTLCSFAKLKFGNKKKSQQSQYHQAAVKGQESAEKRKDLHAMMEQQEQEEDVYTIFESKIKQISSRQKQLFSNFYQNRNTKTLLEKKQREESLDTQNIFGGQYFKCFKGKTLDSEDSIIIYNNQYFQQRIFKPTRPQFLTNQQHLEKLGLLSEPRKFPAHQVYAMPQSVSNNSKSESLADKPQSPPTGNTYNTISLNINYEGEPMQAEDRISNFQSDEGQPSLKKSKKHIFKHSKSNLKKHRKGDKKQELKSSARFKSSLGSSSKTQRKEKTMICLEDEIAKKEEELRFLRKLQQSQCS